MRRLHIVMLTAMLALPGAAMAQTDYTADDVVKHFTTEPKKRGVTFGPTGFGDEKDAAKDAARPDDSARPAVSDPSAFNLYITFDFNSDRLTGNARQNLKQFAEALNRPELKALRFAVDGHTDASGSEMYNQGLSERRAQAVVRFLEEQGIDATRLEARGFGELKPAVKNKRDPRNRRVETKLLD